ncbi:hypothetical protein ACOJBO_43335 [Rhizobium beringeri]
MQVVLRHRQVFVRVDVVLIEELEDLRRGDAVPIGDVPEVIEDSVGGRPVEPGSLPRRSKAVSTVPSGRRHSVLSAR